MLVVTTFNRDYSLKHFYFYHWTLDQHEQIKTIQLFHASSKRVNMLENKVYLL